MNRRGFFRSLMMLAGAVPFVTSSFAREISKILPPPKLNTTILLGYKGSSFLETGYVYAPYIPFYVTDPWTQFDELIKERNVKWEDHRIQYLLDHLT